jgi:hypothetical protein
MHVCMYILETISRVAKEATGREPSGFALPNSLRHTAKWITHSLVRRVRCNAPLQRSGVSRCVVMHPTRLFLLICLVSLSLASGCNRAFYREQADFQAYELIGEKAANPHWQLPGFSVYGDARSRLYDPFAPDCEPMPPDDAASHQLMHYVDDKHGWPKWDANGLTNSVENPLWMQFLPRKENGVVELDQATAVRVALLNSPDFQTELENLYVSALDVSFERFLFDTQFFAGYQAFYTADGEDRNGIGGGDDSSRLTIGTFPNSRGVRMSKLFASGGELVVGFANEMLFEFSGPDTNLVTSLLDFTFIQPLLRGGGRDVVMERLTQVERTLLANVRSMERFRRQFYLVITTGSTGGGPGTGSGTAGGFLGLLQNQMIIRNQIDNIAGLESNLYRLETFLAENQAKVDVDVDPASRRERILQSALQVAQARQALFNAEGRLMNLRNSYEAQLDSYKISLGLPPDLCVEIRDPVLDRLNLISDKARVQRQELTGIATSLSDAAAAILLEAVDVRGDDGVLQNRALPWSDTLEGSLKQISENLTPLSERVKLVQDEIVTDVANDVRLLKEAIPDRIDDLRRLSELQESFVDQQCPLIVLDQVDPAILDESRLEKLPTSLQTDLQDTNNRLQTYANELVEIGREIQALLDDGKTETDINRLKRVRDDVVIRLQQVFTGFSDDLLTLQVIQARARTDTVRLPPIDLKPEEALQIAAQYRRDWMNARANLVDTWRLIQVTANDLESDLDLVLEGDISNLGDNPLDFRSSTGRMRVGFQFDSALTRLSERNVYRLALIEYQQARRNYYTYIDSVSQSLRGTLRTMMVNRFNFEIRRFAVQVAAEQIILNDAILEQRQGQSSGATAARDAVSALSDLQSAQNDFLSVWINYEVLRRTLDYDLGTMTLDGDGLWIDPGEIGPGHMPLDLAACLAAEFPAGVPSGIPELIEGLPGDDTYPDRVLEVLPAPPGLNDGINQLPAGVDKNAQPLPPNNGPIPAPGAIQQAPVERIPERMLPGVGG